MCKLYVSEFLYVLIPGSHQNMNEAITNLLLSIIHGRCSDIIIIDDSINPQNRLIR